MRAAVASLIVAWVLALPGTGWAGDCAGLFAQGRRPEITNPKLAQRLVPLCFDAFAVLHSGAARTPLYAAEHLTSASVAAARRVDRVDTFHDEDALPPDERGRLDDYVHSGFDRGHMAPAGDMPTGPAQAQSFSLANIVPQDRELNRGLWSAIEESVRRLATRRGALYVVTGPIYSGDALQAINGRVLVPTQLFKALYDPETGEAGAYLVANRDDAPGRRCPSTRCGRPRGSMCFRPWRRTSRRVRWRCRNRAPIPAAKVARRSGPAGAPARTNRSKPGLVASCTAPCGGSGAT